MCQHHIESCLCHLLVAVIVGIVREESQGVALIHLNIAKGLERIRGLIEMSAVAEQFGSIMFELHMSVKDLCVRIFILVIRQHVRVYEIHPVVFRLLYLSSSFLFLRYYGER